MVLGFNHNTIGTMAHKVYVEYDYDMSHQVDKKLNMLGNIQNSILLFLVASSAYLTLPVAQTKKENLSRS